MTKRILVVEDEPGIQELLRLNLSMTGYEVTVASDVDQALLSVLRATPDLVLADWNMPGRPGVWLVQRLRADAARSHVPIIMLTARGDEHDKVAALEAGADDYVTKPFKVRELLARVQALLRRCARSVELGVLDIDGLRLDHEQRRVSVQGHPVNLGPTEYRLLHYFMHSAARVHSRAHLLAQVWGDDADLQERTVDVYVGRLRSLIEEAGHHVCIETVRSVGYRFVRLPAPASSTATPGLGLPFHPDAGMAAWTT